MQRDVRLNEIDWVFCWRTSTGEVRPGGRDTKFNGNPVRYCPDGVGPNEGLITIVDGRPRPRRKLGFSLNDQGGISRMGIFVWGHVTSACVIPARSRRELEALQRAAHDTVTSGEAREWALTSIHAGKRVRWGIHVAAKVEVVRRIATTVSAPWILDIAEKDHTREDGSSWPKGARIVSRDLEGRELATLAANTYFDSAPLPSFVPKPRRPLFDKDFWGERASENLSGAPLIAMPSTPRPQPEYRVFRRSAIDASTRESDMDSLAEALTDQIMEAFTAKDDD